MTAASHVLRKHCALCFATIRSSNLLPAAAYRRISSSAAPHHDETVDIVISGGGMVGSAMACALGHEELLKDKKIVLLEGAPKKEFQLPEKFSNRTVAVSPSSVELFERMGAWTEVQQMRCREVSRMQVWDSCSDALISFDEDEAEGPLAFIVENDVVQEAVRKRLEAIADRVDVQYKTLAKSYEIPGLRSTTQNSWVHIELDNGKTLKTKLLIGADGMNSAVRKAGDFKVNTWDYKQTAVVATLELSMEQDNYVAWQRFLPTGPIAILPLSDKYSNLIWTTTNENAKHLKELPMDSFVDSVNDAIMHDRDINDTVVQVGSRFQQLIDTVISGSETVVRQIPPMISNVDEKSRASFPLSLILAHNYVLPRVALIGDAAHRVHPLAGQGVNLGFADVACLRDVIVQCIKNGGDIGSLTYLQQYETTRQRAVVPISGTIHGLSMLYRTSFPPIVMARSLGLQAVNSLSPIKNFFMKGATLSRINPFER